MLRLEGLLQRAPPRHHGSRSLAKPVLEDNVHAFRYTDGAGMIGVGVLHIRGHTTDFSQRIESLEVNHTPATEVKTNADFGLATAAAPPVAVAPPPPPSDHNGTRFFNTRLLAADFLQGQLAALVVELLEPVEAVDCSPSFCRPADIAQFVAGLDRAAK